MPKRILIGLALILQVLLILLSCSAYPPKGEGPTEAQSITSEMEVESTRSILPTTTSETDTAIPQPEVYSGPTSMPGSLDCPRVELTEPGPGWNDLIIGISTREEVLDYLAGAHSTISPKTGNLLFFNNNSSPYADWSWIEVCFSAEDILIAANIHWARAFPRSLEDWLEIYDHPNQVTWGDDYFTRSLIWAEEGLLAVIDVESEETLNVILFPPIPQPELESSWLMASLPRSGQIYQGDEVPLPPEKEVEDPWNIALESDQ